MTPVSDTPLPAQRIAGVPGCAIGVGLPAAIAGASGTLVVEWARQAEALGFASLAVVDRVVYPSHDPLVALAAAAAVTREIMLATTILIAPLRHRVMLAKQLASLAALAPGRLVVGVGSGARADDYRCLELDPSDRGRKLDDSLAWLSDRFDDVSPLDPVAFPRPGLLVGGSGARAFSRMARFGDGWVFGGGPVAQLGDGIAAANRAWVAADRPGAPSIWAMSYFALDRTHDGAAYLRDYYAFLGPLAARLVSGNLEKSAQAVAQLAHRCADMGCGHLVLFPTVADLAELDRLAQVVPRLPARHPIVAGGG
jgi:alkanesulfonate monooxygenase SsuD/methylene tetrahydromethanopterin reductase-like flavin-dependent oxidoreductase (luciferase family)